MFSVQLHHAIEGFIACLVSELHPGLVGCTSPLNQAISQI